MVIDLLVNVLDRKNLIGQLITCPLKSIGPSTSQRKGKSDGVVRSNEVFLSVILYSKHHSTHRYSVNNSRHHISRGFNVGLEGRLASSTFCSARTVMMFPFR